MGSYFTIPLNIDISELITFQENIRKLQSDKQSEYFDINSDFLDYSTLEYYRPYKKFLINISTNVSELLNVNFNLVCKQINNANFFVSYIKNNESELGNYKSFEYISKNKDFDIYIYNNNLTQFKIDYLKYYTNVTDQNINFKEISIEYIRPNTQELINSVGYIWIYNNELLEYWWENNLSQIQSNYNFQSIFQFTQYIKDYCDIQDYNTEKEQMLNNIQDQLLQESDHTQFYWIYLLRNKKELINTKQDYTQIEEVLLIYNYTFQQLQFFEENFKFGDIILFISQEQLTNIVSNNSHIYIHINQVQSNEYDDFSLPQTVSKLKETEINITSNSKKFYIKMDKTIWDSYMDNIESLLLKDSNILNKLYNVNLFNIQSTFPISLQKGTQPQKLYEQFRVSPFIYEKRLIHFGKINRSVQVNIDYGSRFNTHKRKNFEYQKGILPFSFSIFLQNKLENINISKFYKSSKYIRKINNMEEYGLIYDYPIDQFTGKEILDILEDVENSYNILNIKFNNYEKTNTILNNFREVILIIETILHEQHPTRFQIKQYLQSIGFDMEDDNYNVYGFLNTYDNLESSYTGLIVGIIQYTNTQILLHYNIESSRPSNNFLTSYSSMYLNFDYYIHIIEEEKNKFRKITNIKNKINVDCATCHSADNISRFVRYVNVDGYILSDIGQRILIKDQHNNTNGVYEINQDGYLQKIIDLDTINNYIIHVNNGNINVDTDWMYIGTYFVQESQKHVIMDEWELYKYILSDYIKIYEIVESDNKTYIYLPFSIKVESVNTVDTYSDIDVKFQIYDIPIYQYGQVQTNRIFKDIKDYIQYRKVSGNICTNIKVYKQVEGNIPIFGFYLDDSDVLKMIKQVEGNIPTFIDPNFTSINVPFPNIQQYMNMIKISDICTSTYVGIISSHIQNINIVYIVLYPKIKTFKFNYILGR